MRAGKGFPACGSARISACSRIQKNLNPIKRAVYPLSSWLLTVSLTPARLEHGPRAYAFSKVKALPNSRFAFLSNSLRRTGRVLNNLVSVIVVPRCKGCKWRYRVLQEKDMPAVPPSLYELSFR
jgi:hypothetical protein